MDTPFKGSFREKLKKKLRLVTITIEFDSTLAYTPFLSVFANTPFNHFIIRNNQAIQGNKRGGGYTGNRKTTW